MSTDTVLFFKPYPFEVGQKIFIDGGPRKGDWQVVGISDRIQPCSCASSRVK